MGKKLFSKRKFATLAGVNPSTVTRLAKTVLSAAMDGDRVDAAHPDAVAYLEKRHTPPPPPPATGIDPLYEKAVKACQATGRWSQTFLQRELKIGYARAKRVMDMMRLAGIVPDPADLATVDAAEPVTPRAPNKYAADPELPDDPGDFATFDIPADIKAFIDMTMGDLIRQFGTDTRFNDWLSATKKIEDINEKRLKNAATEGVLVSRELVAKGIIEPFEAAHIRLLTDGAKTITRRVTAMHDAKRTLDEIEDFVKDQITSFIRPVKAKVARALRNA